MGKDNRPGRASKRRDRDRGPGMGHARTRASGGRGTAGARGTASARGTAGGAGGGSGGDERDLVEMLVLDAAEAAEHGEGEDLEAAVAALLARTTSGARGAALAEMALTGRLVRALRSAWEGGWQPADIVRAARKRLHGAHAEVVAAVIAAEAATSAGPGVTVPDHWAAQLQQLGDVPRPTWTDRQGLRQGAAVLGLLLHLPVLPHLVPPPSEWGRVGHRMVDPASAPPHDGRMLAKVRALLAKAESTDFEEEANALTAKAQELMARHAIDQAMVEGAGKVDSGPRGRRIGVEDPYAGAKCNLLHAVAKANRCRTVRMDGYGFSTVFGFPGDLDIVELLYTSLLVQATRAMTAAGSVRDWDGRSRTRSFRQSFLIAFAARIGERLREATTAATEAATAVYGGGLLPILAGRRAEVDDAVAAVFPHLVPVRVQASNYEGWVAGRVAADQAHLGPEQQLPPGVAV